MGAAGKVVAGAARLSKLRERPALMKLTDAAAKRITELLQAKPGVAGVRLGIKSRGCNGMSYTMNYADQKQPRDEEVSDHGITVFVEPKAVMHVVGTIMDFVEDEISSEFVFHNPNATGTCGCGESFTTKEQAQAAAGQAAAG